MIKQNCQFKKFITKPILNADIIKQNLYNIAGKINLYTGKSC